MADLIERQAAIKAFEKRTGLPWEDLRVIQPMVIVLEDVPVVDAVEVVRCRDCKYYILAKNHRAFGCLIRICGYTGFEDVDGDDFCSRAERRDT